MRIAIEAQRIFRKDKHGMDFVILETLKELQKRKDGNEYYVFVAPGEDRCLEESENLHIIELRCPTYPLWEQIALPQAVRKLKADLLHCTSNTAPLWCPVPLVLTLHDIIYLEPRQHRSPSFYQEMGWHYRRLIVPRILKKARKIITVSQFECTRIREALQLPKEVIKAVYNGYSAYFTMQETPDESIVQKYIPHPDFLFFLGNTDPKKNAARTLKAYALYLKASQTKRPLLIADLKEECEVLPLSSEVYTQCEWRAIPTTLAQEHLVVRVDLAITVYIHILHIARLHVTTQAALVWRVLDFFLTLEEASKLITPDTIESLALTVLVIPCVHLITLGSLGVIISTCYAELQVYITHLLIEVSCEVETDAAIIVKVEHRHE
jgi:hypothetical protein